MLRSLSSRPISKRLQISLVGSLTSRPFQISSTCHASSTSVGASFDVAIDQKLREDVKELGKILGTSIRTQDPGVFEAVENLRKLGREVRCRASR